MGRGFRAEQNLSKQGTAREEASTTMEATGGAPKKKKKRETEQAKNRGRGGPPWASAKLRRARSLSLVLVLVRGHGTRTCSRWAGAAVPTRRRYGRRYGVTGAHERCDGGGWLPQCMEYLPGGQRSNRAPLLESSGPSDHQQPRSPPSLAFRRVLRRRAAN